MGSLFTDTDKDIKDWSLSYEVMLCDGEPENVSSNSMVKKVIVSVDGEYRIGKTAHVFGSKLIKILCNKRRSFLNIKAVMNNAQIIFLLLFFKNPVLNRFRYFYATKTASYKEKLSVLVAIVNS